MQSTRDEAEPGGRRMLALTGKTSDFLKVAVAAAGRGDLAAVKEILAVKPDWLTRIGSHGRTMLWEAAYRGRLETTAYLADRGADIDAPGCHFTPLLVDISPYCAARHRKRTAVAEFLLARGTKLGIGTAAYLGDAGAVRQHLDEHPALAKAPLPQHDPNVKATVLHYAVAAKQAAVVETLLERGADPRPDAYWLTRFCIWRDRPDILAMLINAGLDLAVAEPPRSGLSNPEMIRLLAAHGAQHDPDHAEGGWPPIVFQSRGDRGGSVDRVRALIERGADVNVRNHKGQTALHCAAKAGFGDIVALLLGSGAEPDAVDNAGETPLAAALRSTVKDKAKLRAAVQALVAAGADPHRADAKGRSPWDIASRKRNAAPWLDAMR